MEYLVLSICISHFLLVCGDQEGIEILLVQGVYVHNCGHEKWPSNNSKPLPDLKTKRRSARDSAEAAGKQRKQGQLKRVSRL